MSNNPSAFNSSASDAQPDMATMPKKRASRAKAPPKSDNAVAKKKTARRGGKRNTGKLAVLLDLPLDCLFEVTPPSFFPARYIDMPHLTYIDIRTPDAC